MNEKEKMLSGLLYDSTVECLVDERLNAKNLCYEYNLLKPNESDKKKEILSKLLGKTNENFMIEPNFYCDYGYNISLGKNFYSNHNLVILDCAKVTFGDNVFIGPNCGFYTAEHPTDPIERNKLLEYAKPIVVGNNVWIGGNVVVIAGVTIGDNVTIGAGSVVVKDIPSNCIAVGNPCKVIKNI
ncbi:MAG: sugar O-acetyltransferase [Candidatus Gastranaerophilales bacterium]|nr:sugar O-acetyltransferase [Candidatus Gastranaerophilales bacterium]